MLNFLQTIPRRDANALNERRFTIRAFGASICAWLSVVNVYADEPLSFIRDIRPILADRCFKCHGPDAAHREADLRLDVRDGALRNRPDKPAIVARNSQSSELVRRIVSTDENERMPPLDSGITLTGSEIAELVRWVDEGAMYEPHWAYAPPRVEKIPHVGNSNWPRHPIDYFVLAELEKQKLKPSAEVDRATWLRRVSLDLTGIPPTLSNIDEFLEDTSTDAYEKVVDRLLDSPRYGERMAVDWLDAARYADTNGYYSDSERQAWPWREWVIRAFNANMKYDQFTIEQLAGDLLPDATIDQKIATGFNRNHMVTNETGIVDEEYRLGYVADRVDTTSTVWLGLTMSCARCHDHKYDPITQRDYYQVFAGFNNIAETGLVKDVEPFSPAPAISLPTDEQTSTLTEIKERRLVCEARMKELKPTLAALITAWEKTVLESIPPVSACGQIIHGDFDERSSLVGIPEDDQKTSGTLQYTDGVNGKAGQFDATQYVEFQSKFKLDSDQPFTFSIWIMPGSAPQGCVISKMNSDSDARGFEILWYKSQPRINLANRYGSNGIEVVAAQKFSGTQWRHLAVSYDGSSTAAGVRVYIDGELNSVTIRRDALTGSIASKEPWRIAWKGTGVGFEGSLDEFRLYDRVMSADEVRNLHWREFLEGTLATESSERTRAQSDKLQNFYIAREGSDEIQAIASDLSSLKAAEDSIKNQILSVSVMEEMKEERKTYVLIRGQYDQRGDEVRFGIPTALGNVTDESVPSRLAFARWLVSTNNPLTARVAVNRLWQQCFGEGIVRTLNDFGLQGAPPSHPMLLDWLAAKFGGIEPDNDVAWDIKAMLKMMVLSATYRQSSNLSPALLARDPENRLLARGARFRLSAEMIRDQALFAGGLLVEKIGGASVKPYQPPGLWEAVSYNGDLRYEADEGDSLYRRSLYTYWKRQSPPPDMTTFDGPTREVCTVGRTRTNTPLQALVLLNDVTYVEAARMLATRILNESSQQTDVRLRYAIRLVTCRQATEAEIETLRQLLEKQLKRFRDDHEAAIHILRVGKKQLASNASAEELAAWTVVASVLLNLDEVVTRH